MTIGLSAKRSVKLIWKAYKKNKQSYKGNSVNINGCGQELSLAVELIDEHQAIHSIDMAKLKNCYHDSEFAKMNPGETATSTIINNYAFI